MERIVIIGPGRVGLALGRALLRSGEDVFLRYHGRHPDPPGDPLFEESEVEYRYGVELPEPGTSMVLLTVPDTSLEEMAEILAGRGRPGIGTPVLHTSGALGAEPLAPLHAMGYQVGTLHPMQAVADSVSGADRLEGSAFALSGEPEALVAAKRLVRMVGGRGIQIPTTRRPLYHAAGVMGSNYLVVLLRSALRLMEEAGASPDEALHAILSLARGAIQNVEARGVGAALTGPVSRGDVETVDLHLRSLSRSDAAIYAALGRSALEMSRERLAPETLAALEACFRRME